MVYPVIRFTLGNIVKLCIGEIEGVHNLRDEPLVIAANHSSYVDDLIIPYIIIVKMKKKFTVFVNSRYYKNYFYRRFLSHYGGIPVDVSKDIKDENRRRVTNEKAIKEAVDSLRDGKIFLIFPEGERSPDGKIQKAKTGVARVALTARVPVIPVGIEGSYDILPKGAAFPKFKRVDVVVGEPLTFDNYYGKEEDYATLEEVTTTIMREIARLVGQEYHNVIPSH
jgi:1-acyl-sn-glycerol-3-phosphate acyltransferase